MVFSMGLFLFGLVSLVSKLYIFINYIYEIEFNTDTQELIIKNSKRFFGHSDITYTLAIDNFKLRYFSGYRVYPGLWIEQLRPYSDILKQYKIGYWKDDASKDLFKNFTNQFGSMR